MQAENVRIPFAGVNLVGLPDAVSDEEALLNSDIFATGYFGADLAGIKPGHSVAVFGCGPVGQFAMARQSCLARAGSLPSISTTIAWKSQGIRTLKLST